MPGGSIGGRPHHTAQCTKKKKQTVQSQVSQAQAPSELYSNMKSNYMPLSAYSIITIHTAINTELTIFCFLPCMAQHIFFPKWRLSCSPIASLSFIHWFLFSDIFIWCPHNQRKFQTIWHHENEVERTHARAPQRKKKEKEHRQEKSNRSIQII